MAMTIKFRLHPHSFSANPIEFATMNIHTTFDAKSHYYRVDWLDRDGKQHARAGWIPRTKSGHRNVFHLLRNILEDMRIDELPENYIGVSVGDGSGRVYDDERRILRQQRTKPAKRAKQPVRKRKDDSDPKRTAKRPASKKVVGGAAAERGSKRANGAKAPRMVQSSKEKV